MNFRTHGARDEDREAGPVRRALLWIVLLGTLGLLVELLLLEHFDSVTQCIPLALLVAVAGSTMTVMSGRGRLALRIFQGVMAACVAAGVVGVYLHYQGNVEFELEREGALHGLALFWESIRGATPWLAPGALIQLGLIGLVYAHGHPVLRTSTSSSGEDA